MYETKAIANAIINKAAENNERITHMKLQKLLYYTCGYYLASTDEPLIDRTFEAWDFGPVVPSIYHEFKHLGSKPILELATDIDWESEKYTPVAIPTENKRLNNILEFVWKNYGKYSGWQLSDMTHGEGSPWDVTRKANPGIKDADIQRSDLKKHFEKFVTKKKAA